MLGDYKNEVSMEGFLLSPLQRLCRYPLLLKVFFCNSFDFLAVSLKL